MGGWVPTPKSAKVLCSPGRPQRFRWLSGVPETECCHVARKEWKYCTGVNPECLVPASLVEMIRAIRTSLDRFDSVESSTLGTKRT